MDLAMVHLQSTSVLSPCMPGAASPANLFTAGVSHVHTGYGRPPSHQEQHRTAALASPVSHVQVRSHSVQAACYAVQLLTLEV